MLLSPLNNTSSHYSTDLINRENKYSTVLTIKILLLFPEVHNLFLLDIFSNHHFLENYVKYAIFIVSFKFYILLRYENIALNLISFKIS